MTFAPATPSTAVAGGVDVRAGQAVQPGLGSIVVMEIDKLLRRPMVWITFLLMTCGTGGMMLLAYLSTRASGISATQRSARIANFALPHGIDRSFEILGQLGMILMVVVGALIIGSEFSWGTVRTMLETGISRAKFVAAKLIVLVVLSTIFLLCAEIAGVIGSLLVTLLSGNHVTLGTVDAHWFGAYARSLVLIDLIFVTLGIVAFAVSTITRSVAAGIAVGIGWLVLEQVLRVFLASLGSLGDRITKALLTTNISALIQHVGIFPGRVEPGSPGVWQAVGVLVLYCVVLVAASATVFIRRDVTGNA